MVSLTQLAAFPSLPKSNKTILVTRAASREPSIVGKGINEFLTGGWRDGEWGGAKTPGEATIDPPPFCLYSASLVQLITWHGLPNQ